MSTLVVGDVHGHVQVVEKALEHDGPVVFLGDLVDSFNISITDQLKCVELVLGAVESRECELLLGNHELSYLDESQRCSGYNCNLHGELIALGYLKKIREYALTHDWLGANIGWDICNPATPAILLTHAGLSNKLIKLIDLNLYDEDHGAFRFSVLSDEIERSARNTDSWFYWAGRARGGIYDY